MNLELSIIVPDKVFLRENVNEVILPTLTGQMGVLKDHIPLLTGLDTGLILIRKTASENWIVLVVTGGFALINNNIITVLVNEAEFGSNINKEDAEKELISSKLFLESDLEPKEKLDATSQYKKARARLESTMLQ